jgi:hypothetical protein
MLADQVGRQVGQQGQEHLRSQRFGIDQVAVRTADGGDLAQRCQRASSRPSCPTLPVNRIFI